MDENCKTMTVDADSFASNGEFVLKLVLNIASKGENIHLCNCTSPPASGTATASQQQVRRVKLDEIYDPDHDAKPSYDKLAQRIASFLNIQIDDMSVTLTYTDEDNDCVNLSSSVELEDAIKQLSSNSATMTLEGVVRLCSPVPSVGQKRISKELNDKGANSKALEGKRISEEATSNPINMRSNDITLRQLIKSWYINPRTVAEEATWKLHTKEAPLILSLLICLAFCLAFCILALLMSGQSRGKESVLYGSPSSNSADDQHIPHDLRHLSSVEYHTIRFDPLHAASGLIIHRGDRKVTKRDHPLFGTFGTVYATEGFRTGIHYWSFRIDAKYIPFLTDDIMIGISDGASLLFARPGGFFDRSGRSLHLGTGELFHDGIVEQSLAPLFFNKCLAGRVGVLLDMKKCLAGRVGVLLDMDLKIVSFYVNGRPVGMVAVTSDLYYPVVSLRRRWDSVTIEDLETI